MNRSDTKGTLNLYLSRSKIKLIVESAIVGMVSGILVISYRFLVEKALSFSLFIYTLLHSKHYLIPIWFFILIICGLIIGLIVKKEPMVSGSGIPQIEGILIRKLDMNWWKVIIGKFIGGTLSILCGLSLGREGPSIQIGAAIGQGFSKILKKIKIEERLFITCGASAGLSAAFNAPFAGLIFALEEIHKNFSPLIMTSALVASIMSDFVSVHFFGLKPIFDFKNLLPISIIKYFYLIILGVITGFLGVLFNKMLLLTQDIYKKIEFLPSQAKPIIAFLISGIIGYTFPKILGGGHDLVNDLVKINFTLRILILLLITKFFFTLVSYGSTAPGGIFLPLLTIGALIGAVYSNILQQFSLINSNYTPIIIILAMASYFTAIVKAPITGIILIVEMTGSFSHLLAVSVVCLTSYIVSDLLNSRPIYELLLERILSKGIEVYKMRNSIKIVLEAFVCIGSQIENKMIKEIKWPEHTLVVTIRRGGREIIPKGDFQISAGDCIVLLVNENKVSEVKEWLLKMAERIGEKSI